MVNAYVTASSLHKASVASNNSPSQKTCTIQNNKVTRDTARFTRWSDGGGAREISTRKSKEKKSASSCQGSIKREKFHTNTLSRKEE